MTSSDAMMNKELVAKNKDAPKRKVNHSELERFDTSPYRSVCPECNGGIVLTQRGPNGEIREEDYCTLCAQQYIYEDIEALREYDREHGLLKMLGKYRNM